MTRIYEHFGIQVDDETVRRVRDFADEQPAGQARRAPVHPRAVRLRARAHPPPLRGLHRAVRDRARPPAARPGGAMSDRADGVRAAVLTAAETLGIQAFPVPRLGEDDALIRVEVCGLGGSDVTQYLGKLRPSSTVYPVILGHVFVGDGRIGRAAGGPALARRAGRPGGDRGDRALLGLPALRLRALLAVRRGRGPAPLRADLGRPRAARSGAASPSWSTSRAAPCCTGLAVRPARRAGPGQLDRLRHPLGRRPARVPGGRGRARARAGAARPGHGAGDEARRGGQGHRHRARERRPQARGGQSDGEWTSSSTWTTRTWSTWSAT